MMSLTNHKSRPLTVQLVGAFDHPDFHEAATLIRAAARCENGPAASPEVVVVAQARPGQVSQGEVESLQRRYPLAGVVTIAGSWCEGETRTGRPWPGVKRFYWYEFPAWWRQQLALHAAGRCPDWARPTTDLLRLAPIPTLQSKIQKPRRGVVILNAANRCIASAITDVLYDAGYATVWRQSGRTTTVVRGAAAGIWDGNQLDDSEAANLSAFCRALARDTTPIVALLDFPRRDRCEIAQQLGAATVLGKPWINTDLITTIEAISTRNSDVPSTPLNRAA